MKASYFLKKFFSYFCSFSLAYTCATATAGTADEFIDAWNNSTTSEFVLSEDFILGADEYEDDYGYLKPLAKNLTITGEDVAGNKPVIAASQMSFGHPGDYQFALVVDRGSVLNISNVTIKNNSDYFLSNGGIYVEAGGKVEEIFNVDFVDCDPSAGYLAGAIQNQGVIGDIDGCTFTECNQTMGTDPRYNGAAAGAILNFVTEESNGIIHSIRNSTFTDNLSGDNHGKGGPSLTATSSVLSKQVLKTVSLFAM